MRSVSDELLADQVLGDLRAAVAVVLDALTRRARRLRSGLEHRRGGAGQAQVAGVDAEVGDGEGLHRLLLGGHDALEGRVPRLVDLLGDAHDGGQGGLEVGHAVLGLAVDLDGRAVDGELAGVRQLRHAEQLGEHRGDRTAAAVRGLVTGDHQVVAVDLAEGAGDDLRRGDYVRALQRLVGDVDGLVGTHGQGLADGVGRTVGTDAQDGHLAFAGLLDLERLFDGTLVDLVDHRVGGLTVQGVVTLVELALRVRVRHLLDQYNDVGHGTP